MIIRHGFMRDNEGAWHNMKMISNIYVMQIGSKFVVVGNMINECCRNYLSDEYKSKIEAQEALDVAFGYIG